MSLLDALLLDPASFNVWIAVRTDGIKGSGTISDPYDGSNQTRFDAAMNQFAAQSNVTIHLGPGPFETKGYGGADGWQMRPGMKIRGSGIDVTTLTLVPGTTNVHHFAIGHALTTAVDTAEVSDLTINCNLGASGVTGACGGVRLMGNHARIHRVKVRNWGTKSATIPCVVLSVITAYPVDTGPTDVVNAGIEGCLVIEPNSGSGYPATALSVGSPSEGTFTKEGHGKSPYIRNCFVDCGVAAPSPTGNFRALAVGWCRGGVVEGNHIHNTDIGGPYQDARSIRDLIVRNNFYKSVAVGVSLKLGQLGSSVGAGSISRSGAVATVTGVAVSNLAVGDRVRLATSVSELTGVYQIRTIQTSPSVNFTVGVANSGATSASVTSVQRIQSVARTIIEGNVIELVPGTGGTVAFEVRDNTAANPEPPDYLHGDVIIRNNKIRYVDGVTPIDTGAAVLIVVEGAKNLIVKDNVLDTVATTPLTNLRCGARTYFNNRTPGGVLIRGVDSITNRKSDELETEAEDAFVMAMFNER